MGSYHTFIDTQIILSTSKNLYDLQTLSILFTPIFSGVCSKEIEPYKKIPGLSSSLHSLIFEIHFSNRKKTTKIEKGEEKFGRIMPTKLVATPVKI